MTLRIIHKGIALALIPLAVNVVWIGLLSASLSSARDLLEQEHKQTVILAHMNKVTVLIANSFGGLVSFASSGNELFREAAEEAGDDAARELAIISKLTAGDADVKGFVEQIRATINEDMRLLSNIGEDAGENAKLDIARRVKKMRGLVKQAGIKNKILMSIIKDNQTKLAALREAEIEAEECVRTVVVLGLISNFAIALFLILLIVKDVKGRLQVLVDNAHLLPKNVPLTNRVSGHDELSELDAEIHAASAQLIESTEYRRGLMQMMAHDLRSPLTASILSVEMMRETETDLSRRESKYLDSIDRGLKTSVELINDLLLLESLEVGNLALVKEPQNLTEMIDTSVLTVGSLAAVKKIEISNEVEKEYVLVDRNRILQVVNNLLSNAIKFSPAKSVIRITASSNDDAVKVSVFDKGCGLSPQDSANLFQKFHQTSEGKKVGGTGLGLAISKLIVESHGGTIGVTSELGHGAEFWFTIPHAREGFDDEELDDEI